MDSSNKNLEANCFTSDIYTTVHFRQCFTLLSNLKVKISKTPTALNFRIAQEVVHNLEIFQRMKGRYNIRTPRAFRTQCSISTRSSPREVSVLYKQELVSAFRVKTSSCFEPVNTFLVRLFFVLFVPTRR